MTKKEVISATSKVAAEFSKLFGPPPLLKTGDKAIYDAILEGLAEDEKPRNFIARILLRDVADLVYQRLWLGRLGPRLIRKPEDGPGDEAAVFYRWIGNYERLQKLLAAVDKKLGDTLKLLDEYRHGLGQRVRQVAYEIVDTEFEERPLGASEQQIATPASSGAAVETVVPSIEAVLAPPVAEPVASRPEISPPSRPVALRERRRLHSAGVRRRRRSAPSSTGGVQSNLTTSGDSEPGKIPEFSQRKPHR
jgi:hypothetical protein